MEQDQDIRPLAEGSAKGDAHAFEALYEHLVDRLYAYIRSRTATDEIATDLTQDAFVELHGALRTFTYRTREEFYAFVFLIVKRVLSKHYANKHTKRAGETVSLEEDQLPSVSSDIETSDEVARALDALDATTREIIFLHHWSRFTFGEIAAQIDMTESAVRVRHHRALSVLAAQVRPQSI